MKLLLIALSLSVTLLGAAEGQSKAAKGQTAPAVIKAVEIPKGAVESEPGTFRHTDAQGKQWIYRQTPFGVARMPVQPAAKSKTPESFDEVKAFDDGESVRFERPGPFGMYRWTAKKSELDDMERKVWDRVQAKTPAKGVARTPDQPAAKSKTPESFDEVKAFDDGESVRFERPGPFGMYRWTAKKSNLDDMERKVWDRVQAKTAAK